MRNVLACQAAAGACGGNNETNRKQVAQDFEGVFVRQILERMRRRREFAADDEEQDTSTEQVKSMFWSFLGDAIAQNGGFGLWEHIYKSMPQDSPGSTLNERA